MLKQTSLFKYFNRISVKCQFCSKFEVTCSQCQGCSACCDSTPHSDGFNCRLTYHLTTQSALRESNLQCKVCFLSETIVCQECRMCNTCQPENPTDACENCTYEDCRNWHGACLICADCPICTSQVAVCSKCQLCGDCGGSCGYCGECSACDLQVQNCVKCHYCIKCCMARNRCYIIPHLE